MSDWQPCELCGRTAIHRHHVMFGAKNRKWSEKYGLVASLCLECHQFVHSNRAMDLRLKERYQSVFEVTHSREEFMKIFGRSYL